MANVSPHSMSLPDWLFANSPTSTYVENFPRHLISTDNAIGATTLITAVAIPLIEGDTVTKISACVGATASGTPTHSYAVLYSGATIPALLGQSTDLGAGAVAANTVFTGTLTTPYSVPSTGLYWAGFIFTATTPPTLLGKVTNVNATAAAAINTLVGLTNGVAVTATGAAGAVAPATMASLTQLAVQPWVLIQ